MITAALAMAFVGSLSYGKLPAPLAVPLSIGTGAALFIFGRHSHTDGRIPIDVMAQRSRLNTLNPTLKLAAALALIAVCIASANPYPGLLLTLAMPCIAIHGRTPKLRDYVQTIALPSAFIIIGGLALLFEVCGEPAGALNLRVFSIWLCVSPESQARTAVVVAKAFGASSCMITLGLTTPMPQLIGALRRLRCPDLIVDLMYLIYRYIFILLTLHTEMRDAARSRLGFRTYRTALRSTGDIYSNLLAASYRFASRNFDAMESRCYDSGIRFRESSRRATLPECLICAALFAIAVTLAIMPL
ncbi:MAG: cobalt ECF transporter T component CbiQ [Oscillospiraceae bacterium]|jgi:cobalt/nickel transport system permease protein|nr:cobalt ECF transporter T component CbiQ [Oscillospiraceae bacterium]